MRWHYSKRPRKRVHGATKRLGASLHHLPARALLAAFDAAQVGWGDAEAPRQLAEADSGPDSRVSQHGRASLAR